MPAVGRCRAPLDTITWLDPQPDHPRPDVSVHDLSPDRVGDACPGGRRDTVINSASNRLARSIARQTINPPESIAFDRGLPVWAFRLTIRPEPRRISAAPTGQHLNAVGSRPC